MTSLRLFDLHRVAREDDAVLRRCLDHDEMSALGWTEKIPGRWHDPAAVEAARESFARSAGPLP
jgi:hypothetical protein